MTKTILILAIVAAFMVGTSMSFVLSDFEAEARTTKPPGILCITEVIRTSWDYDYGLKLCEQDELWKTIDSIMDILDKTTSNDNTGKQIAIINDLEILSSQNKILNERLTSLETTVANLEVTKVETNDCWFFC